MNDNLLLLSLLVLLTPPILGGIFVKNHKIAMITAISAFGYILFAIMFDILPNAYQSIGVAALIIPVLGFWVTSTCEHRIFQESAKMNHMMMSFFLIFFLIHAVIDGASLALAYSGKSTGHDHYSLGYSVILHRFVAVNLLWIALKPRLGKNILYLTYLTIFLGTLAGYRYSHIVLESFSNAHSFLESFLAGSLLHFNFGIIRKGAHRINGKSSNGQQQS